MVSLLLASNACCFNVVYSECQVTSLPEHLQLHCTMRGSSCDLGGSVTDHSIFVCLGLSKPLLSSFDRDAALQQADAALLPL